MYPRCNGNSAQVSPKSRELADGEPLLPSKIQLQRRSWITVLLLDSGSLERAEGIARACDSLYRYHRTHVIVKCQFNTG